MLYFSKLKIVTIYLIIIILSFFSISNFINIDKNSFLNKKFNLGLDLQGGSYLLLEVDVSPLVKEKLQNKLISIRKLLKEKKIKYQNLKIQDKKLFISPFTRMIVVTIRSVSTFIITFKNECYKYQEWICL